MCEQGVTHGVPNSVFHKRDGCHFTRPRVGPTKSITKSISGVMAATILGTRSLIIQSCPVTLKDMSFLELDLCMFESVRSRKFELTRVDRKRGRISLSARRIDQAFIIVTMNHRKTSSIPR